MIRDKRSMFIDNVSVAAAAGTAAVGNVYDTAASSPSAVSSIFDTDDLYLILRVRTSIITGGSAGTVQFQFVSSAATALTSPNIHWQSKAFVTGATAAVGSGVAANDVFGAFQLPKGAGVIPPYLRYLGILVVTATTTTTAGAVDAYMTLDTGFWAAIPEALQ